MTVKICNNECYKKLYDTIVKAEKLLDGDFFKNFNTNVINTIEDQIFVLHMLTAYSEFHTRMIDILQEKIDILQEKIDILRQEKNTLKDRVKALEDKLSYIA